MEYLQLKMQQIQLQMHALQTPGYEGGMNAYQLHHHQQQQQQRPIQQSPESQSQQPPQQQRMPMQAGLKSLYYAANAFFGHVTIHVLYCTMLNHVASHCIKLHHIARHCTVLNHLSYISLHHISIVFHQLSLIN